jgi:Cu(I)/Ag(I) efflux system membrane fusion protein
VTSAHFLIDAESKFQAALQKGSPTNSGHGGHGEK